MKTSTRKNCFQDDMILERFCPCCSIVGCENRTILIYPALPSYSHRYSPKKFTQHQQLFTILVLRQFLKTDYRGIIQMFRDFSDLRKLLDLKNVPHYSTLCYAEKRLIKKRAFEVYRRLYCYQRAQS
jgi:hypothetical protein